jgi:hypothetical protein
MPSAVGSTSFSRKNETLHLLAELEFLKSLWGLGTVEE